MYALGFSPDGTLLASGALDGTVRLHSTDGYEVLADQPDMEV